MTPLVEFRDVSFAYPQGAAGRPPFELRELSFSLASGEVLGLIGPNAAGKTTVIRLLSRVLSPSRGSIMIGGEPASALGRVAVARQVAVVPQDVPQGFPYTVEQLVLMGRFPHAPARFFESREDLRIAREAMALTGVEALAAEPLDRLSGGERQRVVLARALAQQPRLLVLDEPTAHLDLRYQAECVALLRRLHRDEGLGILLVSHDLNLAARGLGPAPPARQRLGGEAWALRMRCCRSRYSKRSTAAAWSWTRPGHATAHGQRALARREVMPPQAPG